MEKNQRINKSVSGFTIVELLIVVVVIAILAAIVIVSYNGVTQRAKISAAQSGASSAAGKVSAYAITNGDQLPYDLNEVGIVDTEATKYEYSVNHSVSPQTFCITTSVKGVSYYIDNSTRTSPVSGMCVGHTGGASGGIANGSAMQTISAANCPTSRTRAVDARDNRTYWVKKIADNKCWMLTNLAYSGGGTNTYGDVKTLENGTSDSSATYTVPKYYIPPGANPTTEPTAPSSSTDGTGQYGYLYNWCAVMGGQATAACANATTPAINTLISICPAGWRMPTTGDLGPLNDALTGGGYEVGPWLGTEWHAQYAGVWYWTFNYQGTQAKYWTGTAQSASSVATVNLQSDGYGVGSSIKTYAQSVRCVAN